MGATCALGTVLGDGEVMLTHSGGGDASVEHTHIRDCAPVGVSKAETNSSALLTDVNVVGLRRHVRL